MKIVVDNQDVNIRADIVVAFDDLFNAVERNAGINDMVNVEALALEVLTNYEYMVFSDGYDKDGVAGIGFESLYSWTDLRREADAIRANREQE